jgi:hypothetical protein
MVVITVVNREQGSRLCVLWQKLALSLTGSATVCHGTLPCFIACRGRLWRTLAGAIVTGRQQ